MFILFKIWLVSVRKNANIGIAMWTAVKLCSHTHTHIRENHFSFFFYFVPKPFWRWKIEIRRISEYTTSSRKSHFQPNIIETRWIYARWLSALRNCNNILCIISRHFSVLLSSSIILFSIHNKIIIIIIILGYNNDI